jgi:hypothetical protein
MKMTKKITELFTPAPTPAQAVPAGPPRIVRVRRLQEYGGRAHYYLDGWPWPVPAWTRRFDGWTLRAALTLAVAVLAAGAAFAWWMARLLGRAQ